AMKEVWYDRQTKRPTRVFLFDTDGRIVLSAKLAQHRAVEVPDVPKDQWPMIATDYQLLFPDSGSRLHIVLDQLKLSRKMSNGMPAPNDATFRFDPHTAGASKVIQLDEDCGR